MPFLILFALQDIEWKNLLPMLKDGWLPILTHLQTVFPFYYGFELAFFWYPYLQEKGKAFRGMVFAHLLTLFILMVVTIISLLEFSPLEIQRLVWPTVSLLTFIQFPFLESFEVIVLSLYIYVLLATVIPYLYIAILGLRRLTKKAPAFAGKVALVVILTIWLLISLLKFPTFIDTLQATPLFEQFGFWMSFVFTIVFALIVLMRNWWKRVRSS